MATKRGYLGELEQVVLLAVLRLQGAGYGTTIRRELEERTGRSLSTGALYATLERLCGKGLLRSRQGEPLPERGGRARRYFEVTASGEKELRRSRELLAALWDGLALAGDASGPRRSGSK